MCLIAFAYQKHPKYPLILLANRDEFYDRPTQSAHRWKDAPQIFAGRDLALGGSWMGITDAGRFSAVTNFRDPKAPIGVVSRGNLVRDFLAGNETAENYLKRVKFDAAKYSGFNLLVGEFYREKSSFGYFSNRGDGNIKFLGAGIYGLSNHLLDTPWAKVRKAKTSLSETLLNNQEINLENLFEILHDKTYAPDNELPDTGVGIERERILSPIFIETPIYGTRCSTVVLYDGNKLSLTERAFI